jgi:prepilin-type N-terminal cleavage/methylation domain-containing protein
MKMHRPSGFTLIEVIVAIVLSAIAMAAILPLLGNVFLMAHEPREQLHEAFALQSAMDELVVWHRENIHSADLGPFVAHVDDHFPRNGVTAQRGYIEFIGEAESATSATNLFKVTLQNSLGETLVRLFTVPL